MQVCGERVLGARHFEWKVFLLGMEVLRLTRVWTWAWDVGDEMKVMVIAGSNVQKYLEVLKSDMSDPTTSCDVLYLVCM